MRPEIRGRSFATARVGVVCALAALAACDRSTPAASRPVYNNSLTALVSRLEVIAESGACGAGSGMSDAELNDLADAAAASPLSRVGKAARKQLIAEGAPGVLALKRFVADTAREARLRAAAAEVLGDFEQLPTAAETAAEILEIERDESVRAAAARSAGRIGRRYILPRLLLRLKYEKSETVAVELGRALVRLQNYYGLVGVIEVIQRGRLPGACAEGAAIARLLHFDIPDDAPAETVTAALQGAVDQWIRTGAPYESVPVADDRTRLAFARDAAKLGDNDLRPVDDARFVLERGGLESLESIMAALTERNAYTRVRALEVIGHIGAPAAPAAGRILSLRFDPEHRAEPLLALGRIGDRRATPALADGLKDPDPEVRVAAARGLLLLKDPASFPQLRDAIARDKSAEPGEFITLCAKAIAEMEPKPGK